MMKENYAPQVLIVDDDQMAQATLEAILYREGYHLHFASSGIDALARLATLKPDVILLDVMMPQMDGFVLCQKLKASPDFRHIPIILVTALDDNRDLIHGLDAGADEFVAKPVNGPELRARVRSMLRIKQQYDDLQRSVYLRDLLANIVAHDLRNPLAAILLYMQLLKKKSQGTLLAEQNRYLEMVLTEAQQMSDFLEDTLVLAKLEQGTLAVIRNEVDVGKTLQEIQRKLAPIAQAKQVQLAWEQPPTNMVVEVDLKLFSRALEHLLAYTVKSSSANGQVLVRVEYLRRQGEPAHGPQWRLIVQDNEGVLSPADKLRMFDKYAVIEMKQKGQAQFGLGLAYCKLVVDAHNGTLRVTPNAPKGTIITIEI